MRNFWRENIGISPSGGIQLITHHIHPTCLKMIKYPHLLFFPLKRVNMQVTQRNSGSPTIFLRGGRGRGYNVCRLEHFAYHGSLMTN